MICLQVMGRTHKGRCVLLRGVVEDLGIRYLELLEWAQLLVFKGHIWDVAIVICVASKPGEPS